MLSSLADETPEGRSIVDLAETHYGQVAEEVPAGPSWCRSTAQTRMSGLDVDGRSIRKGRRRLGPAVGGGPGGTPRSSWRPLWRPSPRAAARPLWWPTASGCWVLST